MKLYEFVDKLYAMGDMESPKTIRSKKTLNESLMLEASSDEMLDRFFELNAGVDPEELLQWILQNVITDEQLREMVDYAEEIEHMYAQDDIEESLVEDDLDEGVLGGLAGAAIGGLAGNSLGHPVLGAIGGGLAGSAIQNALSDEDLNESLTEAANPENAEVNAVLRKWANSDRNRISKHDQKVLDDAGITLKDDFRAKMAARKNESLTEDKDLSTVKGSMTKILQDNREKIDACGSAKEVHDTVAGLLAEAGLDTPATRRLLLTLKKQRGLTGALQAVYNSILKGSDLGVIKEGKEGPVAYTIVMIDNNQMNFGFVGWDPEADYYDVVFTNGLEEVEDWAFTAWDGDGTINVYRFDTPEQAEHELKEAQREFDEKLYVIAVRKNDRENLWFPVPDSFDEVTGGENELEEAANANPPRYQVKGCGKNGRVENHDQFMIFDSEYNDEIDYYDLCEIIRDVNEDNDLSSSQVEDIATDVISELYFKTPDEDLGEIISMYSY